METGELASFLRDTLRKNSRAKLGTIQDSDVITRDLGFDSFSLLNVVLDLEDRFGFEIDPTRLEGLREITFSEFVALVADHLAPASPRGSSTGRPGSDAGRASRPEQDGGAGR